MRTSRASVARCCCILFERPFETEGVTMAGGLCEKIRVFDMASGHRMICHLASSGSDCLKVVRLFPSI